jgi:hypothetical protein
MLKSTQAISHVRVEFKTNFSELSIIRIDVILTLTLLMKTEEISETLVLNSTLTWLIAREYFSTFIHYESLKSYKNTSY